MCLSNYAGNGNANHVGILDACLTITPDDKNVNISGSLVVNNTNILTTLSSKQDTLNSSSAITVNSINAASMTCTDSSNNTLSNTIKEVVMALYLWLPVMFMDFFTYIAKGSPVKGKNVLFRRWIYRFHYLKI